MQKSGDFYALGGKVYWLRGHVFYKQSGHSGILGKAAAHLIEFCHLIGLNKQWHKQEN